MALADLPIAELRRLAEDVYPVEFTEEENKDKKKAAAALEAVGASWSQYLKRHSTDEIREKYAEEYNTLTDMDNASGGPGVVTSDQVNAPAEPQVPEQIKIITKEEPKMTEKYLVKMTRQNPLYQVGPYKFTKDYPYALVDGKDLRKLLEEEEGFRQAFPDEVEDFYT
jgi:hypothetical protein